MENIQTQYKSYPASVIYEGYTRELSLTSVGEGWSSLIEELHNALDLRNKNAKVELKIIQVKEKWGCLTVYTDFYDKDFEAVIRNLSNRSTSLCELCGDAGSAHTRNFWTITLCPACASTMGAKIVEKSDDRS